MLALISPLLLAAALALQGPNATPPPASLPAPAAPARAEAPPPIQDNSFLIEEAYNQESGVIQHISTFQRSPSTGDWLYTFTEEWPVPGQKHQLSVTVPYQRIRASADGASDFGDVLLNYRRQIVGSGESRVAVSPRLSLVLPTGNRRQLRGSGALGYQVNVPASIVLASALVTHLNAGFTLTPGSRNANGQRADTMGWNLGQSLVWLAGPTFNVLVELAYNRSQLVTGAGRTVPVDAWTLNPGVRWAMNFKSGLQVVPGVSVPIGVGPSRGQRSVFLYLSLEHPLWKAQ